MKISPLYMVMGMCQLILKWGWWGELSFFPFPICGHTIEKHLKFKQRSRKCTINHESYGLKYMFKIQITFFFA